MGRKIFVSIIIPTRDRAKYLDACLDSCVEIKNNNIEIIVSDNRSIDNTKQIVLNKKDSRILYIKTKNRVSMRENFEFALNSARGDYVLIIGDDDAIVAEAFSELIGILQCVDVDAATWPTPFFRWGEGVSSRIGGRLRIRRDQIDGSQKYFGSKAIIDSIVGGKCFEQDNLPAIYHGIVRKSILDKIKTETGNYFNSSIPDVYMSYTLLFYISKFVHINIPVSINAVGRSSGGDSASRGADEASRASANKFIMENKGDLFREPISGQFQEWKLTYLAPLLSALHYVKFDQTELVMARTIEKLKQEKASGKSRESLSIENFERAYHKFVHTGLPQHIDENIVRKEIREGSKFGKIPAYYTKDKITLDLLNKGVANSNDAALIVSNMIELLRKYTRNYPNDQAAWNASVSELVWGFYLEKIRNSIGIEGNIKKSSR